MDVENELRASFDRHEPLTPPPLLTRITETAVRRRRRRGRLTAAAVTVALLSVIAVPAAWAGGLFRTPGDGTSGGARNQPSTSW